MSVKATMTGNTGPGATVTSLVLNNVKRVQVDHQANMIYINYAGTYNGPTVRFAMSLAGVTTISCTISGSSYSYTFS